MSSVAILLGVLAGYFVGTESILFATSTHLGDYSSQLLQREEELIDEVASTLKQANASPYTPCSEQDIALMRRLAFSARFLKDVGRLHQNTFLCSATTGKLTAPIPLLKPDFTLSSGAVIYRSYPLHVPAGAHGEIAGYQNADVVIGSDVFSDFPQNSASYAVGVVDPDYSKQGTTIIFSGVSGAITIPYKVLESQGTVRSANKMYRASCDPRHTACAVAEISMQEVWRSNRVLLSGYIASGAGAGISCAAAIVLARRRKRNQTGQLKRAILDGKLTVAYQPIVELGSHRIVGAEALARWIDEDGEHVHPETIIGLAEAGGFVSEITQFVLTRAIEEIAPILESNPAFRVTINLAPADLDDPKLLLLLNEKLNGPIQARNVAFELSERATSNREVAVAAIRRLRERGHATFIDDFGTGYSNLAYLTELNVDGIKINRSFIATIGTESVTASIVPQILAVARALNLDVVVQGIEREDQAMYFASDNPKIEGQGWFFGLPVPAKGLQYLCAERSE